MSTRTRQTTRQDSDVYDDEFGLVTDADIAAYLADQDAEAEAETRTNAGFLNLQTASGLGLIGLGALYSLQQIGLLPFFADLSTLAALLPVMASVLIMLTGFGVLSWSPAARRRRKARERAAKMHRQARKTMGRNEAPRAEKSRDASSSAESPGKMAAAAATLAFGVAGRAAMGAGRAATRAAELAYARQQSERRTQGKVRSTRLAKDRRNRKISGVAAGVANYTGLDPLLIRIAFVAMAVFTNGIAIPLYFILAMLMPNEERDDDDDDPFVRVSRD